MDLRNKDNVSNRFSEKAILKFLFVLLFINLLIGSYRSSENTDKIPSGIRGQEVVFYGEFNDSAKITSIGTTDEYIFFGYSNYGVVAAYRKDGTYVCSFAFYSNTNGTMRMRCFDGKMYVSDHTGYEYVFEELGLQEVYAPSERQHPVVWYEKTEIDVVIAKGNVYDLNDNYIMALPGKF